MEVKLSDGTIVTFKDFYSHKADTVLQDELDRGVVFNRDSEGNVTSSVIPAANVRKAYELVMEYLITSPQVTQKWLDDLPREDYGLLYQAALDINLESRRKKAEGKKSR